MSRNSNISALADENQRFVRNDGAFIALVCLIGSVYSIIIGRISLGGTLVSVGFAIVGISVVWEWRRVLKTEQVVPIEPFFSALTGGIIIGLSQTVVGYIHFSLPLVYAIMYGFALATVYDFLLLGIAKFRLSYNDYVLDTHPLHPEDPQQYVFESEHHISFVEQEAKRKFRESQEADETEN